MDDTNNTDEDLFERTDSLASITANIKMSSGNRGLSITWWECIKNVMQQNVHILMFFGNVSLLQIIQMITHRLILDKREIT